MQATSEIEEAMRKAMSRQYYCVYCTSKTQEKCEGEKKYPSASCKQIKIAKFEKWANFLLLMTSLFGLLAFFGIQV